MGGGSNPFNGFALRKKWLAYRFQAMLAILALANLKILRENENLGNGMVIDLPSCAKK